MRKPIVASALVAMAPFLAMAESSPDLQGRWSAVLRSPTGNTLGIELSVRELQGVWKYVPTPAQAEKNPCLGKEFPLLVTDRAAAQMTLRVEGSKAMAGCPDFSVDLKQVDERTLDATFTDGRTVQFVR